MLICKCVLKLSAVDCRSGASRGHVEIKVASQQNGRYPVVLLRIVQSFLKLGDSQLIIASALQVQVVGHYCSARDVGLADQRQASSQPLLKGRDLGKKPVRTPKMRLLLKSNDSGIGQRPTRECCLAVV